MLRLIHRDFQLLLLLCCDIVQSRLIFLLVLQMITFLEVTLRLQNAKILLLNSWKAVPAPGSPDAATRVVQKWSFVSNLQHGCTGRVAISVAHF